MRLASQAHEILPQHSSPVDKRSTPQSGSGDKLSEPQDRLYLVAQHLAGFDKP